jgi:hypothetical protein
MLSVKEGLLHGALKALRPGGMTPFKGIVRRSEEAKVTKRANHLKGWDAKPLA